MHKVINYKPPRDERGQRFVPFCSYGWHEGIAKNWYHCEKSNCIHYRKFYLNTGEAKRFKTKNSPLEDF